MSQNPLEAIEAYPATLPIEIALRVAPLEDICAEYGISLQRWFELREDPVFQHDLTRAVALVKQEGMTVKMKAQLQADELLKTNWRMIHDPTVPASVRADLSKFTFRVAGLTEPPKDNDARNAPPLMIQINL